MTEQLHASAPDLRAPAPQFSVREFARTAVGSHRAELDLDAYRENPLSAETLRVLAYLRGIEHSTMNHLRNMLVTPTHKDPRVTAFLTTWAFEKYWIADALSAVLSVHPLLTVQAQSARNRFSAAVRVVTDRFLPIRESIVANTVGVDIVATHMAEGAIDSWVSQSAYSRLEALEPHPELVRTLERIRSIKDRHLDFFLPQADFRLGESRRARSIARRRLRRADWPVAASEQPTSETGYFFTHLFAAATHVLDEVDARVDALPGQKGLGLLRSRLEAVA
jgi:hypothetical protein